MHRFPPCVSKCPKWGPFAILRWKGFAVDVAGALCITEKTAVADAAADASVVAVVSKRLIVCPVDSFPFASHRPINHAICRWWLLWCPLLSAPSSPVSLLYRRSKQQQNSSSSTLCPTAQQRQSFQDLIGHHLEQLKDGWPKAPTGIDENGRCAQTAPALLNCSALFSASSASSASWEKETANVHKLFKQSGCFPLISRTETLLNKK